MVRIRSNKWYSGDGQRRTRQLAASRSTGIRRLVSLCGLLALVILLMQKAADPIHIERAFSALGVPLDREVDAVAGTASSTRQSSLAPEDEQQRLVQPSDTSAKTTNAPSNAASDSTALPQAKENRTAIPTNQMKAADQRWLITCNDLTSRIWSKLSAAEQKQFCIAWFDEADEFAASMPSEQTRNAASASASERTIQLPLPTRQSIIAEIEELHQSMAAQAKDWQSELDAFRAAWLRLLNSEEKPLPNDFGAADRQAATEDEPLPSDASDGSAASDSPSAWRMRQLVTAITSEVDQWLLMNLRNAAPWERSEQIVFWRLFQRTAMTGRPNPQDDWTNIRTAPRVRTQQLEAQPKEYLGKWVRFAGSVRRVERVASKQAPFSLGTSDVYWLLWLRGVDGASQPVAVYTQLPLAAELAKMVKQVEEGGHNPDSSSLDYPQIEVQALGGKRLAYASPSGVQVAPTLFASGLTRFAPPPPPVQPISNSDLARQLTWAAGISAVVAALIVTPIWLGSRRRANRNRAPHRPTNRNFGNRNFGNRSDNQPSPGSGRRPRLDSWLFIIAVTSSAVYSQTGLGQIHSVDDANRSSLPQPPWQTTPGEQRMQLFQQRIQDSLSRKAGFQTWRYLNTNSNQVPDLLLQLTRLMDQFGWKNIIEQPGDRQSRGNVSRLTAATNHGIDVSIGEISGIVRSTTPVQLSALQSSWFSEDETDTLYHLRIEILDNRSNHSTSSDEAAAVDRGTGATSQSLASHRSMSDVFVRQVPATWLTATTLRQPCRIRGLQLTIRPPSGSRMASPKTQADEGGGGEDIQSVPDQAALRTDATTSDRRTSGIPPNQTDSARRGASSIETATLETAAVETTSSELAETKTCWLAQQPIWTLPESDDRQWAPELPSHWRTLGRAGWNLSWIDHIAEHHQQALTPEEQQPFYGLLDLSDQELTGGETNQATTVPDSANAADSINTRPLELLAEAASPETLARTIGTPLQWRVRLVRGAVVERGNNDSRAQPPSESVSQQQTYFQFDGFVDIGNQVVRFQPRTRAGQPTDEIRFAGEFPVTIVTHAASDFAPASANPNAANGLSTKLKGNDTENTSAWEIGRYAILRGRFYRLWSYESEKTEQGGAGARQLAPLVIASDLVATTPPLPTTANSSIGWFGYALCLATLIILGSILFLAVTNR